MSDFLSHTMSQTSHTYIPFNFPASFDAALEVYKRVTGKNLLTHLFATQLQACNSPGDVLAALQGNIKEHLADCERLSKWLRPIINVLYVFSVKLGEGSMLVNLNCSVCLLPAPNVNTSGILTCKNNLHWHWGPLLSNYPLVPL
jgi:hypothetical protein